MDNPYLTDPKALDELEAMEQAATPGPWETTIEEHGKSGMVAIEPIGRVLHDTEWADPEDWQRDQDNAEAIVALRNAAPHLIAAVRTLRQENASKQIALERIRTVLSGAGPIDRGIVLLHKDRDEISALLTAALTGEAISEVRTLRQEINEFYKPELREAVRSSDNYAMTCDLLRQEIERLRAAAENVICRTCDNRVGWTGEYGMEQKVIGRLDWRTCLACEPLRAALAPQPAQEEVKP